MFRIGVAVSMTAHRITAVCSMMLSEPSGTKHKHTFNFIRSLYDAQRRQASRCVRWVRVACRQARNVFRSNYMQLSSAIYRPSVGPIRFSVQWEPGALFTGAKEAGA